MSNWTVKNELLINGTWIDVTNKTRAENKVAINYGYQNEQGNAISPSSCTFTLNNRDGQFSNRNPLSPYFGLLGRNTQFRSGITDSTVTLWARAYGMAGTGSNGIDYLETADKSVLDVTTDLDLRIDISPYYFDGNGTSGYVLASKYENVSGNQRSWFWCLQPDGTMKFFWSSGGASPISAGTFATSTAAVSFGNSRKALRVTIDVNNGAAGRTIVFYTSDTINGTWTQLGSQVIQAGTTSIFSSTAVLQVAGISNSAAGWPFSDGVDTQPIYPFRGRLYGFQMYNGIGGTLVANADLTSRSVGTTSWSDGLTTPNTWTLRGSGGGEITNVDRRFWGEIPEFPQAWDTTGTDVYVDCVANDIVRRLTQGAKTLESPVYLNLLQYSPKGYWPMEDGVNATVLGSASASGALPGQINDVTFGADATFPGSAGCATLNSTASFLKGSANTTSSTGNTNFILYIKCASTPTTLTFVEINCLGGTLPRWRVNATSTTLTLQAFDGSGASVFNTGAAFGALDPTKWFAVNIELIQSGSNISYALNAHQVGSTTFYAFATGTTAGNVGRFTDWSITNGGGAQSGYKFAHAFINQRTASFVTFEFANSSNAYLGETAGARFQRLTQAFGVTAYLEGYAAKTEVMGYQPLDTLMNLLQECVDVDGGFLTTTRAARALRFWSRKALQNQSALTYDYSLTHLYGELKPTDDDQILRNDITISRPTGASARAVKASGANNVNDPATDPQGVGTYATSYPLNTGSDSRLASLAQYARTLGTWDDLRYPIVSVHLNRTVFVATPALSHATRRLEQGRPLAIANLPSWLPPDTAELLIRGGREVYDGFEWQFSWNTQPYGPYRSINNLSGTANSRRRVAATTSSLATALTSSDTTIPVGTPSGKLWGTTVGKPGNFPLDILTGGERITISGIVQDWVADNFNRSTTNGTWGSSSTGSKAWTVTGTAAAGAACGGTVGVHNNAAAGSNTTSSLALSARVSEMLMTHVTFQAAVTGVGGNATISLELGTASTFVHLLIFASTGSNPTHWLSQVVNNVETVFDSTFPSTGLSTTTAMSVRFQIIGTSARAKVWQEGTPEPNAWTTSITLTQANVVGDFRIATMRNASSTNTPNYFHEFDNLSFPRIQALTASARSVNSIVKAQTVDTSVQVFDKFYTNL